MNAHNTNLLDLFFLKKYPHLKWKKFDFEGKLIDDFLYDELDVTIQNQDPDYLEDIITLYFIFEINHYPISKLNEILLVTWHYRHEDIASLLQDICSPESINYLYQAIQTKFNYLSFDDSHALAVKCIWALGDIGTQEALDKLEILSNSNNDIIKIMLQNN
ncbi:HEAT repeat domain-containing protein [Providencia stuartii]|uniref:HEAT repeat domain-containing protein n=1 Tax=Providencia stuartii (strain MRSN 2154) TaxID=1157951 RepID=A0A140NR85_PROSM|nr:HEAT repeat domain-containing protein [Providencia stuartii]AFH95411.1 hypothetical protein S70_18015 [Providencia stuartii MRSN 2154]